MELTQEQKVLQIIIQKAWEDDTFKQELITNPMHVIENLIGKSIHLPKGKKIIVQDQTNESIVYINIPAQPNIDDMELNEEQLEIIAGGGNPGAVLQNSISPLDGIIGN